MLFDYGRNKAIGISVNLNSLLLSLTMNALSIQSIFLNVILNDWYSTFLKSAIILVHNWVLLYI